MALTPDLARGALRGGTQVMVSDPAAAEAVESEVGGSSVEQSSASSSGPPPPLRGQALRPLAESSAR
eukprot:CAMPEP_0177396508 /NCGR_PEP_ID=MMETSP0368-20130122/56770_1 /TAXON_ID=447022 ORGANISM="Scrippsiella hangoei-like, Strain SHHI-4" /NCGR_SAMPLE_ID=MMETSP0368 /ASSEMBLY_ACC=CAM_ASM_000363 /LENGTH=66 /DNA_ID=CAMNT_0018863259 /DNA_START=34 /DNA_END=231 /DNA_ORIENTATION=+